MTHRLFSIERFLAAKAGHTAIEYSMIAAFIAIGIISALSVIGGSVHDMFAAVLPGFAGKV
jgi:Flp pilus assembly pilin Flp